MSEKSPAEVTFVVGKKHLSKQPKVRFIKQTARKYKAIVHGLVSDCVKHDIATDSPTFELASAIYKEMSEQADDNMMKFMAHS